MCVATPFCVCAVCAVPVPNVARHKQTKGSYLGHVDEHARALEARQGVSRVDADRLLYMGVEVVRAERHS